MGDSPQDPGELAPTDQARVPLVERAMAHQQRVQPESSRVPVSGSPTLAINEALDAFERLLNNLATGREDIERLLVPQHQKIAIARTALKELSK